MAIKKLLRASIEAARHPAFLFSAGNVALIIGQAELVAIMLNVSLTVLIFAVRFAAVLTSRALGVPFVILALVNFFTAFSIELNTGLGTQGSQLLLEAMRSLSIPGVLEALAWFDVDNLLSTNRTILAAHASALALLAWATGSLYAGKHERKKSTAERFKENPQTYYGAGDMLAVNASGSINPFSFPFMVLGFIKSVLIGHKPPKSARRIFVFIRREFTAARIYAFGYIVGGATTLAFPAFAIAQFLWALGYLGFKKDTK